mmetsp:Transcript_46543/g.92206  ORF Transcript_46543/g.92206 Transcript_46543/m.92206 type:complete len:408 (-) Transcript_46543:239-1462(-)
MPQAGYHTVPVVAGPAEGFYTIAPSQGGDDFDDNSPSPSSSYWACCGNGNKRVSPKAAMTSMVFHGSGAGEYIKEEMFVHVGSGQGKFALREREDDEAGRARARGWLCCCCLVLALIVAAILLWLFLPEDFRSPTRKHPNDNKGNESAGGDGGGDSGVTTRSDGLSDKYVSTLFKVINVDYNQLMANPEAHVNFVTEIQQGVALSTKEKIPPENVTVLLSPGSVVVNATVRTNQDIDTRALRDSVAATAAQLEKNVEISLAMMHGLETVQSGGSPEVTVIDVKLCDSIPFDEAYHPTDDNATTTTAPTSESTTAASTTESTTAKSLTAESTTAGSTTMGSTTIGSTATESTTTESTTTESTTESTTQSTTESTTEASTVQVTKTTTTTEMQRMTTSTSTVTSKSQGG